MLWLILILNLTGSRITKQTSSWACWQVMILTKLASGRAGRGCPGRFGWLRWRDPCSLGLDPGLNRKENSTWVAAFVTLPLDCKCNVTTYLKPLHLTVTSPPGRTKPLSCEPGGMFLLRRCCVRVLYHSNRKRNECRLCKHIHVFAYMCLHTCVSILMEYAIELSLPQLLTWQPAYVL